MTTTLTSGSCCPADRAEDPQRQRVLRPGRERRDDDLVEGQREREQRPEISAVESVGSVIVRKVKSRARRGRGSS